MLCYLNKGIIIEQVIVSLINNYLQDLKVDKIYNLNQIHVALNNHFAKLYKEQGEKAADSFPAIVVSTFDDDKDRELNSLRPQTQGTELSRWEYGIKEIEKIMDVYEPETANGKKIKIPGICVVTAEESIAAIMEKLSPPENEGENKKERLVYGYAIRAYRRDVISIDIWAENIQLKNELYEQIRLFVLGDLRHKLTGKYKFFDPRIDDDTVKGQRVLPFLVDYGLTLAGANIQFDVTYAIEQNVIDTKWNETSREMFIGGHNYVKK